MEHWLMDKVAEIKKLLRLVIPLEVMIFTSHNEKVELDTQFEFKRGDQDSYYFSFGNFWLDRHTVEKGAEEILFHWARSEWSKVKVEAEQS